MKILRYNNTILIMGEFGLLDFVKQGSIWRRLQEETRPIVLYGMGDGALKIMAACQKYGIGIRGIFASDEYVRGHSFEGYPVKRLAQVEEEFDDFIVLLCFAAFTPELLQKIFALHQRHEVLAPDVPVFGDELFDEAYFKTHESELEESYSLLADEFSKRVFENVLNFKLSGKIDLLRDIETPKDEVYRQILHLGTEEHYLDLGGYDGDTVLEFLEQTGGKYGSVTVLEPDVKNFRKLTKTAKQYGWEDMLLLNKGVWSEDSILSFDNRAGRNSFLSSSGRTTVPVCSVDSLLKDKPCTFIKMDVEGAEREVLLGAKATLRMKRPKLAFSGYHRSEDLFALPLLLNKIEPSYQIFLRHHPYLPAWETNFYAVADKI